MSDIILTPVGEIPPASDVSFPTPERRRVGSNDYTWAVTRFIADPSRPARVRLTVDGEETGAAYAETVRAMFSLDAEDRVRVAARDDGVYLIRAYRTNARGAARRDLRDALMTFAESGEAFSVLDGYDAGDIRSLSYYRTSMGLVWVRIERAGRGRVRLIDTR